MRGATHGIIRDGAARDISIHAPHAGCDSCAGRCQRLASDFNPRTPCGVRRPTTSNPLFSYFHFNPRTPCGVRLAKNCSRFWAARFQSTHPLRGATAASTVPQTLQVYFNPRTPCGVRLRLIPFEVNIPNFNPRTPCGVRRRYVNDTGIRKHFNPRTPCGVRLRLIPFEVNIPNFNPRTPCGVRLSLFAPLSPFLRFQSTHPLRGATQETEGENAE